jgi:hypothetical protein
VLIVGATSSIGRLVVEEALRKGHAQSDLDAEFARLDADPPGALDAVHDLANMPLQEEPLPVRQDLETVSRRS